MADYHLKTDGNDSLDGSSWANAWKTAAQAAKELTAGDTLTVADGTYTDEWLFNGLSGNSSNHITIQAANARDAVIKGNWSGWSNWFPDTYSTNPWDWADDDNNLEKPSRNDFPNGAPQSGGGYFSGTGLFELRDCDYVDVIGFEGHSHAHRGFFFNNSRNCTFQNCYVHHTYETGLKGKDSQDCEFWDCDCAYVSIRGWMRHAGYLNNHPTCCSAESCERVTWRRCTVYWGGGEGIGLGMCSTDCHMYDCTIYDIRTATAYFNYSGNNSSIERCLIYTTNIESPSGNDSRGGMYRDEKGGDKPGKCNLKNLTEKAHFKNNIVVGWGRGFWIGAQANLNGLEVFNNLFYCPDGYALYISAVNRGADWAPNRVRKSAKFYNNIFIGDIKIESTDAWRNNPDGTSSGKAIFFKNNFYLTGKRPANAKGDGDVIASNPGLVAPDTAYTGGTLVDTNYKLTSSSPCRNAGTDVGIDTDYFGGLRDDGTMDIGPHEYGSLSEPDLEAAFSMSATEVDPSTAVTLTDQSSISAGAIDTWTWEQKVDGGSWVSIGTSQNESFTPTAAGDYTIRLTITDTETAGTAYATRRLYVNAVDTGGGGDTGDTGDGGGTGTSPDSFANLLTDGDFPDFTNWSKSSLTQNVNSENILEVTGVTSAASAQVYQSGISITNAQQYIIEFDSRIDGSGKAMGVRVIDHVTTSTVLLAEQSFNVPAQATMKHFLLGPITASGSSANARFQLRPYALNSGSTAFFDNMVLRAYSPPTAGFSASASTISRGESLTLTDSATGSPTSWIYEIKPQGADDEAYETISTEQSPTWVSDRQGIYTIRQTVANGDGTDTATTDVTIKGTGDWMRRSVRKSLRRGLP